MDDLVPEKGDPQREQYLADFIKSETDGPLLLKEWTNATKMRKWNNDEKVRIETKVKADHQDFTEEQRDEEEQKRV